jgi:hypothetical protein
MQYRKSNPALASMLAVSITLLSAGHVLYAQENPNNDAHSRAGKSTFAFSNRTQISANDFHAVFTGSGGTLHSPRMTKGPRGAVITAKDNEVDITFPTPAPPGGQIGFSVRSRFVPIQFYYGYWTLNGWPLLPPAFPDPK